MKKLLIIIAFLACLGTLAFAGFGSATDLDVRGGTIQAGADVDLKLAGFAGVTDWGLNTATGNVDHVHIELCNFDLPLGEGGSVDVTVVITDFGHNAISQGVVTVTRAMLGAGGPICINLTVNLTPAVPACQIYDIRVFIEGGLNSGHITQPCPLP